MRWCQSGIADTGVANSAVANSAIADSAIAPTSAGDSDADCVHRAGYRVLHAQRVHDVQEQVLQLNTAGELIWTADGTHLSGYRVDRYPGVSYIVGKICAEGCAFKIRFGTKDGQRRAYLTADYGHDNPGTLVDVEVSGGELVVTRTNIYVPGSFTLSRCLHRGDAGRERAGRRSFCFLRRWPQ